MNLDELKLTGVMSAELVKKNISWKKKINDKYKEFKCDVFVKKVSFYDFEKLYIDRNQADSQSAMIITTCVRLGETGDEQIPYDVACSLHPSLGISLVNAVHEVNKNSDEEKK